MKCQPLFETLFFLFLAPGNVFGKVCELEQKSGGKVRNRSGNIKSENEWPAWDLARDCASAQCSGATSKMLRDLKGGS